MNIVQANAEATMSPYPNFQHHLSSSPFLFEIHNNRTWNKLNVFGKVVGI
jgi:hypothetical protein